jgi:hypothetical protein
MRMLSVLARLVAEKEVLPVPRYPSVLLSTAVAAKARTATIADVAASLLTLNAASMGRRLLVS